MIASVIIVSEKLWPSQGSDILRRETLQLEHAKSTRASLLTEVLDKKASVSLRSPMDEFLGLHEFSG